MAAAVEHTEVNRLRDALVQIATQHGTSIEELKPPPGYGHLPLAIIDSVYSLRSPYSAARAAVSAYCTRANIADRGSADGARDDLVEHTIQDFLSTVSRSRGDELTTWFGGARYKAPGTNTLKAEVCVAAAEALHIANVNERRDLDNATRFASAKGNWRSVRGLGQQSWSYFTMLVGVEDWKVDTWVNGFVVDVVGRDVTSMEARALLDAATANLAAELECRLSKRALDHAIWQSASGRHPR